MGSGISFFEGFRRSLHKRVVGIIGDSTFVHSGIAGLINAAYNKTIGLVIILDNGTTAMTGFQPHPATGITIKGEETKRLKLEDICHSCGADSIDVLDPHNIKELEKFIRKRLDENQLSVIIARAPCRLIVRKKAPLPEYHREQCTKCYLCLSIDCPALFKSEDDFIEIHSSQCTGCNLCVEVCTAKALKKI
jgi:indolepyruvate ferredoxin oxidoreductase alpha subunit